MSRESEVLFEFTLLSDQTECNFVKFVVERSGRRLPYLRLTLYTDSQPVGSVELGYSAVCFVLLSADANEPCLAYSSNELNLIACISNRECENLLTIRKLQAGGEWRVFKCLLVDYPRFFGALERVRLCLSISRSIFKRGYTPFQAECAWNRKRNEIADALMTVLLLRHLNNDACCIDISLSGGQAIWRTCGDCEPDNASLTLGEDIEHGAVVESLLKSRTTDELAELFNFVMSALGIDDAGYLVDVPITLEHRAFCCMLRIRRNRFRIISQRTSDVANFLIDVHDGDGKTLRNMD